MKPALQTIKSVQGKPEYVLLPISVYEQLHEVINTVLFNPDFEINFR